MFLFSSPSLKYIYFRYFIFLHVIILIQKYVNAEIMELFMWKSYGNKNKENFSFSKSNRKWMLGCSVAHFTNFNYIS